MRLKTILKKPMVAAGAFMTKLQRKVGLKFWGSAQPANAAQLANMQPTDVQPTRAMVLARQVSSPAEAHVAYKAAMIAGDSEVLDYLRTKTFASHGQQIAV